MFLFSETSAWELSMPFQLDPFFQLSTFDFHIFGFVASPMSAPLCGSRVYSTTIKGLHWLGHLHSLINWSSRPNKSAFGQWIDWLSPRVPLIALAIAARVHTKQMIADVMRLCRRGAVAGISHSLYSSLAQHWTFVLCGAFAGDLCPSAKYWQMAQKSPESSSSKS